MKAFLGGLVVVGLSVRVVLCGFVARWVVLLWLTLFVCGVVIYCGYCLRVALCWRCVVWFVYVVLLVWVVWFSGLWCAV